MSPWSFSGRDHPRRRPEHHLRQGPEARRRFRRGNAHPGHVQNARLGGRYPAASSADVGLGNSVIQETGKNDREFQIRTMEVISTKDAKRRARSPRTAGQRVISALQGDDGKAEQPAGLSRPQQRRRRTLAALLQPLSRQGEQLAERSSTRHRRTRHLHRLSRALRASGSARRSSPSSRTRPTWAS